MQGDLLLIVPRKTVEKPSIMLVLAEGRRRICRVEKHGDKEYVLTTWGKYKESETLPKTEVTIIGAVASAQIEFI